MDRPHGEAPPAKKRPHEVPMRLFGDDTSPEVERFLIDAYRRMSGAERIARVNALNHATLAVALANIREHHPGAKQRELLLRLAVRRYGAAFVRDRLGWDAAKEGLQLPFRASAQSEPGNATE